MNPDEEESDQGRQGLVEAEVISGRGIADAEDGGQGSQAEGEEIEIHLGLSVIPESREYFLKEYTARYLKELYSLHRGGECVRETCPHCLYEAQFKSEEERRAWEEYELQILFRSTYGG